MTDSLKNYCSQLVPLTDEELGLIDSYFKEKKLKRKEYLLEHGKICDVIAFIVKGSIRHFHVKSGEEKTCDISLEDTFVTDFQSFTTGTGSLLYLQALEDTILLTISKKDLATLYKSCAKYETVGRLMAEKVALRSTEIAMSLSSEKPEERYRNLLIKHPDLFQRVPQKYIANFLGISPESLSRIRMRMRSLKS